MNKSEQLIGQIEKIQDQVDQQQLQMDKLKKDNDHEWTICKKRKPYKFYN